MIELNKMKTLFFVLAFVVLAALYLGESVRASDETASLKELLQDIKASSREQVDEKLELALAKKIKAFTGADTELEFIRDFEDLLLNEDWFDQAKWGYTMHYLPLLTEALTRYSSRKMIKITNTPFDTNRIKLSSAHKEMLIWLEKLEEKKANAIVRGNFEMRILVKSITVSIERQQRLIVGELGDDVHNMCAFEGRRPTVEDLKAIGLEGDFLAAAIEELGLK